MKQIDLDFPFWIKPIKSFGSYLGFYIDNEETFYRHLKTIQKNIPRIGNAFNLALKYAKLPPEVEGVGGNHCIVEEIITGDRQNGPEGYVYNGEVHINGITDTIKDEWGKSFTSYEYPSVWPEYMQKKSVEVTKKLLSSIGLENHPFNLEFIWDEATDDLKLIEVNPRISQSLSDMFEKVHGTSNHEVAVELALGEKPEYPRPEGKFKCAAKFMWRHYRNALVTKTPTIEEIEQVKNEFPRTELHIEVKEGMYLSELRDQDSYSYEFAILMMGAQSHEELLENNRRCREILTFEFAETEV
ncbi:MAG: ATP-grasp domain-containing protein [Sulfurimonas sp.]